MKPEENERLADQFEECKKRDYSEADIDNVLSKKDKIVSQFRNGPLKDYYDDICSFIEILQDNSSGRYKEIPKASIAAIVWSLLYLVNPFDLIFDCVPILGHADDIAVISMCSNFVKKDIEKYKKWKENMKSLEAEFEEE